MLTDRPRTPTLTFDTTSLLNQENKDKQLSQNILKTILPDAVRVQKNNKSIHVQTKKYIIVQTFKLVQRGPSKSTSQALYELYTTKRHSKHLCLH